LEPAKEICLPVGRQAERQAVSADRQAEPILQILKDEPRSGRPVKIDTRVEAHISVIACSGPPDGSAKWTLRMVADRLVKLDVIDSISHESVRVALKKTN
jgi:hypothetical protein